MRVLFIFLVLANLTYYWYSKDYGVSETAANNMRLVENKSNVIRLNEINSATTSFSHVRDQKQSGIVGAGVESAKSTNAITGRAASTRSAVCYSMGPFVSNAAAISAKNKIAAMTLGTSVRMFSRTNAISYWVYLPKFKSYDQAKKVADSMRNKGYKDYYIVASGDNENAVSLGLFKEQSGAERRRNRVVKLGYAAKIETKFKTTDLYWIDYKIDSSRQPSIQGALTSMAGGSGNLQLVTRSCSVSQ